MEIAIVTGAGSGIGAATAKKLASNNYKVIIGDLDLKSASNIAQEIEQDGGSAVALELDVANMTSIDNFIDAILSKEKQIDVLVNNAGIGIAGTVETTSPQEWDKMFSVNVKGIYGMSRKVLPLMKKTHTGRIINVASVAGVVGLKDRAGYSATKGAIIALTRAMQADVIEDNIRINAVAPGTIETPWVYRITADKPNPEQTRQIMKARQPINRMGTPQEVADAIVFLASTNSSFVWGSILTVDGGLSAF